MSENLGDKIKKSIDERSMEIKSMTRTHVTIYDLTQDEYDRFIEFVKKNTPNQKGYEALKILLNNFYESIPKQEDKNEGER